MDLKSNDLGHSGSIPDDGTKQMEVFLITKKGCIHFLNDEIDFDACWRYTGPAYWKNGYPIIRRHNKNWVASRFIWYFFTGRDYRFREVHHKCLTRDCVNPLHLEELTTKRHRRYHNGHKKTRNNQEVNKTSE